MAGKWQLNFRTEAKSLNTPDGLHHTNVWWLDDFINGREGGGDSLHSAPSYCENSLGQEIPDQLGSVVIFLRNQTTSRWLTTANGPILKEWVEPTVDSRLSATAYHSVTTAINYVKPPKFLAACQVPRGKQLSGRPHAGRTGGFENSSHNVTWLVRQGKLTQRISGVTATTTMEEGSNSASIWGFQWFIITAKMIEKQIKTLVAIIKVIHTQAQ